MRPTREILPLADLPNLPMFEAVLSKYGCRRGEALLPRWNSFSFTDFLGWHARLSMSKKDGDDYRFNLFGSEFVKLFARDLTGELLCNSLIPERIEETRAHFKELAAGPFIGWTKSSVPTKNRDFLKFEVLDLPLSNENGDVGGFLHILGESGRKST